MTTTAQRLLPFKAPDLSSVNGNSDNSEVGAVLIQPSDQPGDLPGQNPLAPMSYGTTARPPLDHLKPMSDLPEKHIPTASKSSHRLIIIGDVHGQLEPLEKLLKKAECTKSRGDHVIFTGDLVSKGPDSPGVVALAMGLGASAVRGDHEDRVLLAYKNAKHVHVVGAGMEKDGKLTNASANEDEDDLAESLFSHGDDKDLATARTLNDAQRKWLGELPVILRVGKIPNHGDIAVVHAGLVPGTSLKKQDPWAIMTMRTLVYPAEGARREQVKNDLEEAEKKKKGDDKDIKVSESWVNSEWQKAKDRGDTKTDRDVSLPIEGHDGRSWAEAWNEKQEALDEDSRLTVVYGHDAKTGLNVGKYTYGLDSDCVRGGQLSALVFFPGETGKVEHMILHVDCEKARGSDDEYDFYS